MCFEVFSENKCRDTGVPFLLSQLMKGRKIELTLFFSVLFVLSSHFRDCHIFHIFLKFLGIFITLDYHGIEIIIRDIESTPFGLAVSSQ